MFCTELRTDIRRRNCFTDTTRAGLALCCYTVIRRVKQPLAAQTAPSIFTAPLQKGEGHQLHQPDNKESSSPLQFQQDLDHEQEFRTLFPQLINHKTVSSINHQLQTDHTPMTTLKAF